MKVKTLDHPLPSHPYAARNRPAEIHLARLVMTIPLMTESTQENIVYVPPINMTHTSLTSLRLSGNPALTETSITNEEIEAYEADQLYWQQSHAEPSPPSLYAEQMGWVDDHAEEEGMAHDYQLPEL
jgi:hypothetical protein